MIQELYRSYHLSPSAQVLNNGCTNSQNLIYKRSPLAQSITQIFQILCIRALITINFINTKFMISVQLHGPGIRARCIMRNCREGRGAEGLQLPQSFLIHPPLKDKHPKTC